MSPLKPCPHVCWRFIYEAVLNALFYGATDWRAGGCESVFNIVNNPYLNHQIETRAGVLEDECSSIVKIFLNRLDKIFKNQCRLSSVLQLSSHQVCALTNHLTPNQASSHLVL